jgi:hypothetical protein
MLLLLPLIFFALIATALGILRLRRMRMAYLWLLPAIIALVCWVVFIILPIPAAGNVFHTPGLFSLSVAGGLSFNLDETSWGFIYLVVSLVLVYFLTLLIRLDEEKRTLLWIGWLVLSAIAILSFAAGNLTTLIVSWFLFDILDFLFTFLILHSGGLEGSLVGSFTLRLVSLGLLIIAGIFMSPEKAQWLPAPLAPFAYFLLFFAAFFRTGLLPIRFENREGEEKSSSFIFLKETLLVLSGFSLLSFLPVQYLSNISQIILTTIFFLLSLTFVLLSIMKKSKCMDLWMKSILCLGCMCVFAGSPIALVGWGGVAMLGSGISYFYTQRSRRNQIFAWLGILSLSGLPYSIAGFALAGLTTSLSIFWLIPGLFVYSFLLFDFIRIIREPGEEKETIEPLYLAFYIFGLFQFALSPFAILIKNPVLAANVIRFWWVGIALLALCLGLFWLEKRIRISKTALENMTSRISGLFKSFSFEWLVKFWQWLSWSLSAIVQFLTRLLEGEGGVIWAIVILSLLVSLLSVGRS